MSAITVLMPCYNRAHDLIRTLKAYDRQTGDEGFELIAVDDASSDDTFDILSTFRPSRYTLRVERNERNMGPAATRNRGLALVESPLVLIVGDDIQPDQNLVRAHLAAHRHHTGSNVAVLGHVGWPSDLPVNTLMAHIDGLGAQQFSYHYLQDGQAYDFRHFYTANISIKTATLTDLDPWFDTDFPYAAYEDVEFAYRLSKRGLKIVYAAALRGYHYHYHTIWTFATRQRRSGEMSKILISKHPELRYAFRAQYLRMANLFREYKAIVSPLTAESIERVETFAYRLASAYEWQPNQLLDRLYLGLLDYFYYDGVIHGYFGNRRLESRLRSAHVRRYLRPALISFLGAADQAGIPIPVGCSLNDIAQII